MEEDQKHAQLNEEKWDKWAKSFDGGGWVQKRLRKHQSQVVSLLKAREGIHFLDVGCGTGWAVG